MDWISVLLNDYTLRVVALGAGALGLVSGALGSFALLRKQGLLGDAISHAALPGVVLAFLLTRSKEPLVLMAGAGVAGWIGVLCMNAIVRTTRIKEDTALGLILSVFFGFGLVLLTLTQRLPDARQAGLDHFLFGQAAALLERDVWTIAGLGALALGLLAVFWKEFKLLSFDREYAATLGQPVAALDLLLTTLLVAAIVIGLQAVGVVLMSAMIVAPAAAARQWTDRLAVMVALAAGFGALSGVVGTVISSTGRGLSTGPVMVLVVSGLVLFSLLFAANRGLVWNWTRNRRNRSDFRAEALLCDLYEMASQHGDLQHPHALSVLQAMNPGQRGLEKALRALAGRGWVSQAGGQEHSLWALTAAGAQQAQRMLHARSVEQGSGGTHEHVTN